MTAASRPGRTRAVVAGLLSGLFLGGCSTPQPVVPIGAEPGPFAHLWARPEGATAPRGARTPAPADPCAWEAAAGWMDPAGAVTPDRGFLWHLRRGTQELHLFGTLHLGRADWVRPGPAVRAALARSDLLALEIDPQDLRIELRPTLQAATLAAERAGPAYLEFGGRGELRPVALGRAAAPASDPLPETVQLRLHQARMRACADAPEFAAQPALRQLMSLSLLAARADGLHPSHAQELVLSAYARQQRWAVVALETVESQRRVLQPVRPVVEVERVSRLLDQLESGAARRVLSQIGEVWERGDLATLERYEQWCACTEDDSERSALRELNQQRNAAMAARIDALARSGARPFVAVGALHMVGPEGLPALLRQRGFSVERLPPWP